VTGEVESDIVNITCILLYNTKCRVSGRFQGGGRP
jgi:hypothetical protein